MARTLGISRREAEKLIEAYWGRNWSIRKFAEDQRIKRIGGKMWVLNPVSKFWYSLRNEKDIFSTINQGTGVYFFDSWVKEIVSERPQLTAQFHDEGIWEIKQGNRDRCTALINRAIDKVNNNLRLNVEISCDIQYGGRYSEIH